MAKVNLPQNLVVLFPGAPRQVEIAGATVIDVIDGLNARFPGMRSRLLDAGPALRQHILVFVNGDQSGLFTPVPSDGVVLIVPSITGG